GYLEGIETCLELTAVSQPNAGAAAARNRGVSEAQGEIILFIDDDVVPTPTLIEDHLRHHETASDIVVIGPMLTPPHHSLLPWVAWEQAMLEKQYNAMQAGEWEPTPRQFYTGNSSIARQHLDAAGGFDTEFRRAEDVELAYRLADMGLRFIFDSQAVGYHYAERSFDSWMGIA
ncbi:MAG: glycosyltransferase family 2 protein, partial [Methylococcales bacterium]|nr:glycosyltransferase family 2 protein [Methylococcales bacterium]